MKHILVLNAGSSTLKAALFKAEEDRCESIWEGLFETQKLSGIREGGKDLLEKLWNGPNSPLKSPQEIDIVGHRIVHGGESYFQPTLITPEVKKTIGQLAVLAPLHQPAELEGIDLAQDLLKQTPQIAVFDTAFHHSIPLYANTYAGPYKWRTEGIRRYGFHGISHHASAHKAAELLNQPLESLKIITCHLGSGASLAAISQGHSIDTTMGFTPLEGLMMGTRSGSIDPGLLLYLLQEKKISAQELDKILNHESGLYGISGGYSDMRDILQSKAAGDQRGKLAFEMYIYSLRKHIGSMAAALNGLDVLLFTAGVGENSPEVRAEACAGLGFLGIALDQEKNKAIKGDGEISLQTSSVKILVIKQKEEKAIAQQCYHFIS